jgi:hypothetical protein
MTGHPATAAFRTGGTAALDSLGDQAVLWGLVVAVAVVVVCAATWALASTHSHPQAAARAKTGILVALGGALLLGAGQAYLAWLSAGQANAFMADPASYKAETAAPTPGVEIVDKTGDWVDAVNTTRASTGAAAVTADGQLQALATSCASKLAAGTGACPAPGQFYEVKLSPSQVAELTGTLTPAMIADWTPILATNLSGLTDDPRVAMVAARNTQNGTATLVVIISAGPCPDPCQPKSDGAIMPRLITHVDR